ncbi:2043_t:CDS:10 [Funneliformis mosseae]|uniref:2043_t:CDS:1 n=1 Tax=Funneliformis mosseae TaxID=27381 RepID=A0A9N9BL86_FUNMO|nr:2043_t:CDS:10 [Funneliformis mosseae]
MTLQSYDVVVSFFSVVLDIFFREIRPRGSHKVPKEGPVIFVAAPHANQFVDPLILMRHCQRHVSFLVAEKSMRRKYIGAMARAVHAIPVTRPQDLAQVGKGRIQLLNRKTDPTRITGIGTAFTQQLKVGSRIALPMDHGSSEVKEILSDTELVIKREFKEIDALNMLTDPEGTQYKCFPHIDHSQVYKIVFDTLKEGHCIGIFPEGGSHDRTEILPLKAGVTIMALGAIAANPDLNVKIVPCEFGSPISIPPDLVEKFKEGGSSKREACSKLLEDIYNGLRAVTVNTPDYETLMFIQAGRRLYKPAHRRLPISQIVELNRRFVAGYEHFKDNPRVQEMRKHIMEYNKLLKYHGLKDHQVNRSAMGGTRAAGLLFYRVILLATWGILGLPGERKAKEAVRVSSIKVAGRDVLATWKLLVALVVTPMLYGFYTFIVVLISFKYRWILKWKVFAPISTFCTLVTGSYATIRFYESGIDVYKSIRPLFLSLLPWTRSSIKNLRTVREILSTDITNLINELAPQIYHDFDVERIVQAAAERSVMSTLSNSLFQSPINWLDDRIFNWERQGETSEFDDVIYFLEKNNGSASGRSRTSSWASGSNSRPRSRANSITSGPPGESYRVEALTELPRGEPFSKLNLRTGGFTKIKSKESEEDPGYHGDGEDDLKLFPNIDHQITFVKLLLFPTYRSTDFEVHRNWLAITHSLPISKWYYEDRSEWTLDYPPFFAWFEWYLSQFASLADKGMLKVDNLNYASDATIYFQRTTVIMSELVFFYALKKGLCHAYWAPNFWALYAAVDRVLIVVAKRFGWTLNVSAIGSITRGLVGDVNFALLPQVQANHTFILTLVFQTASLIKLWKYPTYKNFLGSLILNGYSSFLFGWHVHEKAILLVMIPFR